MSRISFHIRRHTKKYYETNTVLARLEQQIENYRQQKKQLEENLNAVLEEFSQASSQHASEIEAGEAFIVAYEKLHPEWEQSKSLLENVREKLAEFESVFQTAQKNWDDFHQSSAQNLQRSQVEQTKIQHIEKQCQQIEERLKRLTEEQIESHQLSLNFDLTPLSEKLGILENEINAHELSLTQNQQLLSQQRENGKNIHEALDKARTELQALKGRHASLMALQESALGKNIESHQRFLKEMGIENNARLAQILKVRSGWEHAVETVLSQQLESICIENFEDLVRHLSSNLNSLTFTLNLLNNSPSDSKQNNVLHNTQNTLASVCDAPIAFQQRLSNVYLADDLNSALNQWQFLTENQQCSVITREGFWLGHNFLIVFKSGDSTKGNVILREKELSELLIQIQEKTDEVQKMQDSLENHQEELKRLESVCVENQNKISTLKIQIADLNAQIKVQASQKAHQESRQEKLSQEIAELKTQIANENSALEEAKKAWQVALEALEKDSELREQLEAAREEKRTLLQASREEHQKQQQQTHSISTQIQVLETQRSANQALSERLSQQINSLEQKKSELSTSLDKLFPLESEFQEKLEIHLSDKLSIEKNLQEKRAELSILENQLREFEQEMNALQEKQLNCRQVLEQKRLQLESASSTINSLKEQCQEMGENLENLLEKIPEDATQSMHEETLQKVCAKIERLGLINLAAIAEKENILERKTYLDSQHQDLTIALELLEEAIRKIDKETRARFKETYEKVNGLFQELFPSIFGGGQASLELTGDDLLETGVQVMARPPGKRNSTIHLLSGGEKALTAIALVFSIFQLNPAPFCMLDEVDAPLDDANIGRFCGLVKKMSEQVQFIFISHNKIAIEMAEHLIGVTMNEPGVSRCVSVDVKAAMEMAEA